MKPMLLFILIHAVNISCGFSQEIEDNPKADSVGTTNSNKTSHNKLSGYSSLIGYSDFNKGAVFSPMLLIQGKVPGFTVNCLNANDPNPNLQIQSRGTSTLVLSTEPLYIINGIPMESPDIVPVENIESIEILKNLSETAPYGIRGANGVVIIKTKSSYTKPLTVSYSTYMYGETFANKSNYMSVDEWRMLKQKWASSDYVALKFTSSDFMIDYNANTDWRKEISQNKLSQAHNIGFLGGYEKTSYSVMLNYDNYNGIIQKTDNTTYSGQLSVSQLALKDKLQIDISAISTYRKYHEINNNPYLGSTTNTGVAMSDIIAYTNYYNPTAPVYNSDGTYEIAKDYWPNPVSKINNTTDNRVLKNTLISLHASYEIIKGLKLSASWSEHKTTLENTFSNYDLEPIDHKDLSETKELNNQKERIYSVKLNYNKTIAFHNFDISLSYLQQNNIVHYNYQDSVIRDEYSVIKKSFDYDDENYDIKNLSASVKYNYKSKYYFSFNILKEKSPLYNLNNSTQYFPSFSSAWILSNEDFLREADWLNELKIRASYGVGQRRLITQSDLIPTSNEHGENMHECTIGVDVSLLSNRLCFSTDYYNRKTKDGVLKVTTPYSSYLKNETEIQNKGWEFYIKAKPFINPIKWTVDFNISFNKNIAKSDDLSSLNDQPVGNFFGYRFAGFSSNGQMLVYDNNGNITTGNADYQKILGNGVPKSFFGFTNTFEYKNFELSILLRGALGFEIKNLDKLDGYGSLNYKKSTLTTDPMYIVNEQSIQNTDYIIEKGDYLKISNITLGYTIPLKDKKISSFKVYVACNNVALFTKATNVDPEMAGITGLDPGVYYCERYPETRIFLLGLKVSF
jgi:TonB-dependent starch-binding outer membrane protein SusC